MCDGWQHCLFSPPHCKWDKAYNDQFDNKTSAFFPPITIPYSFLMNSAVSIFPLQEHRLHKMRKSSEVGLNDEVAAILREFITADIIFMQENSCQALLSGKQRHKARYFWQTPFPCAQKHSTFSLLLTRAVNSWKITQTWLYASLHKAQDSPSEWKGRWGSQPKKLMTQGFFFHCLGMREENQIKDLENK